MKGHLLLLIFYGIIFFNVSCKKSETELDKISGLWYVRIVAEQQINEKGILAFKSYLEYKPNDSENYATFNFQEGHVIVEERRSNSQIVKEEYKYSISDNTLILTPNSGSLSNQVYKMTYLGIKNSLILDMGSVDINNKPFNLKKVLVRTLPKPDPENEEIGTEPNQGTPTGGE